MGLDELNDPAGVWDDLSDEKRELLKENMYADLLNVHTEWEDGQVRWDCPECEESTFTDKYYGTARCEHCMKIVQSENWEVGDAPENPEEKPPEPQDALSW